MKLLPNSYTPTDQQIKSLNDLYNVDEVSGSHRKDVNCVDNYHVWSYQMYDLLVGERLLALCQRRYSTPYRKPRAKSHLRTTTTVTDGIGVYDDDIYDDSDDSHVLNDELSATVRARRLLNDDLLLKWNRKSKIAKPRSIRSAVEDDPHQYRERVIHSERAVGVPCKTYGKITAASRSNLKSKLCNK